MYLTEGLLTVDSGNRFEPVKEELKFEGPTELHLDETLLPWDEVCRATYD